jgi:hypothetical protein
VPRGVIIGLAALRLGGVVALLLLLWNPTSSRAVPDAGQPLVLLDASLSMGGLPTEATRWRAILDTTRALGRDGMVWRFGTQVASFDSGPPMAGASDLRPALEAAAARGGAVTVVSDGAISDLAGLPADVQRRPRVVVVPRAPFADAFVASVDGSRRIAAGDTLRLTVSYGTAGPKPRNRAARVRLEIRLGERALGTRAVTLPDSGMLATELELPASRLPAGWSALEVRLVGADDPEPRDDARWIVVEVGPQPAAVVLAAPPDWDARFLARTLSDVARVPMRTFVRPGGEGGWRDGSTLAGVGEAAVQRAVDSARLVVLAGDPDRLSRVRVPPRAALIVWPTGGRPGRDGDWYVDPAPASPVGGPLAGVRWDSLPPLTAVAEMTLDTSGSSPALTARLARRGPVEPVVVLSERGGRRQASIAGQGLWRWSFRGGTSGEAYRALVAAVADWLLAPGAVGRERAVPVARETARGLPLAWRWSGNGAPQALTIDLQGPSGPVVDTLVFDGSGRADLLLPPGSYRYALRGGSERGLVVVEEYSDEWRPAAPVLTAQEGAVVGRHESVGLRDRWWLYVLIVGAFAAEWAWRRRQGLP